MSLTLCEWLGVAEHMAPTLSHCSQCSWEKAIWAAVPRHNRACWEHTVPSPCPLTLTQLMPTTWRQSLRCGPFRLVRISLWKELGTSPGSFQRAIWTRRRNSHPFPDSTWRIPDFQARFIGFSTLQRIREVAWCKSLRSLICESWGFCLFQPGSKDHRRVYLLKPGLNLLQFSHDQNIVCNIWARVVCLNFGTVLRS